MCKKLTTALCLLLACGLASAQSGKPAGGKPAPVPTPKPGPVGNTVQGVVVPDGNGGYRVVPAGAGTGVGTGTVENTSSDFDLMRTHCQQAIEKCRTAISKGDWVTAKQVFDQALINCVEKSLAEALAPMAGQLETEGRTELAAAMQLYEKEKYVEAIKELGRISRTFTGLPVGTAALETLRAAETDPKAQAGVQENKALAMNDIVERILYPAAAPTRPASQPASAPAGPSPNRPARVKTLTAEKQLEAVDTLTRIALLFPLAPTAKQAAADLDELKGDKAFQDSLSRQRKAVAARAALNKAELYRNSGMSDKAVEAYKEVVTNFPGTPEAKQAQDALAQGAK